MPQIISPKFEASMSYGSDVQFVALSNSVVGDIPLIYGW